jgi:hypothetical protein
MRTLTRRSLCRAVAALSLLAAAALTRADDASSAGVGLFLGAFLAGFNSTCEDQLPDTVLKTVHERFPAASVLTFDRDYRRGLHCYDLVLKHLERRTRVVVAADGSIGEIESRLSLESLPAAHQALVRAATGDGEVCSIDTHLRLGLPSGGTFVLLDEPTGCYDVRFQRNEGERARLVKIPFTGDEPLLALTGAAGVADGR